MKRVLIITYYWPPSAGSGVQRWLKFSKYLPEFAWQPVVYTPENPDFALRDTSLLEDIPAACEVIKRRIWEPYGIYRKLTGGKKGSGINFGMTKTEGKQSLLSRLSVWVRGNLIVPDPRVFWVRPSVRFLKKYLKQHPVDVIVTTGPPHSMHLIGLGLKKSFPKLKWIADMRDPWATFDILNSFNLSEKSLQKQMNLEKSVLDKADQVVMVSPSLHEEFQPFDYSKLVLINNGFDEDDFSPHPRREQSPFFNIYHTGLLNYIRNPGALWEVLSELCEENAVFKEKLKLELIGSVDPVIVSELKQKPVLSGKVNIRGWMEHEELLKEYQKADLFLLLPNQSRNTKAQITGKAYEYFAMKRPILHMGEADCDVSKILYKTKLGLSCSPKDKKAIKKALLKYFNMHIEGKPFNPLTREIEKYTRKNLTKKLVEKILEQ